MDTAEQMPESTGARLSHDELARQQSVRPTTSMADLIRSDVVESDDEVDEVIAFTHAQRHADIA